MRAKKEVLTSNIQTLVGPPCKLANVLIILFQMDPEDKEVHIVTGHGVSSQELYDVHELLLKKAKNAHGPEHGVGSMPVAQILITLIWVKLDIVTHMRVFVL